MKIRKIASSLFPKFTSALMIVAVVLVMSPFQFANAAGLTTISDTMSREKAATKSVHKIVFTSTTAMVASGTIAINFATFTGTVVFGDIQICHGTTTGLEHGTATVTGGPTCTVDETVAASAAAATVWGATYSGTTLTLTAPSSTWTNAITAGQKVTVVVSAANITNPAVSTPSITITNSNGDSGAFSVPIIDDDQVTITASVNSALTFDLDTYATSTLTTETATPYTVALGTLTTAAVNGSNESSVNGIWFDLATNSSGGAVVTVQSANAALKSTSTPADTIPSATATMAAGTSNYGICANRNATTTGTLTKVAPFASTCTTTPAGNGVGALTTSPQAIYNTGGAPLTGGRGEIMVDGAISTATAAHADYTDTLTLIATATY
jgi:hypothetical protein